MAIAAPYRAPEMPPASSPSLANPVDWQNRRAHHACAPRAGDRALPRHLRAVRRHPSSPPCSSARFSSPRARFRWRSRLSGTPVGGNITSLMLAAFGTTIFGLVQEYADRRECAGRDRGTTAARYPRPGAARLHRCDRRPRRGGRGERPLHARAHSARRRTRRRHRARLCGFRRAVAVLNRAALLHDIGKIGVPDAILNKPGALTDDEFAVIKEHPARGYTMIANIRSLHAELGGHPLPPRTARRLRLSRWPDGDAIPLIARIIAVADVFDALTSPRPYRGPWSRDQALALLDRRHGHAVRRYRRRGTPSFPSPRHGGATRSAAYGASDCRCQADREQQSPYRRR